MCPSKSIHDHWSTERFGQGWWSTLTVHPYFHVEILTVIHYGQINLAHNGDHWSNVGELYKPSSAGGRVRYSIIFILFTSTSELTWALENLQTSLLPPHHGLLNLRMCLLATWLSDLRYDQILNWVEVDDSNYLHSHSLNSNFKQKHHTHNKIV
jgi:hypothetical protein